MQYRCVVERFGTMWRGHDNDDGGLGEFDPASSVVNLFGGEGGPATTRFVNDLVKTPLRQFLICFVLQRLHVVVGRRSVAHDTAESQVRAALRSRSPIGEDVE